MAIPSFDAAANGGAAGASTFSFNHTVGSGEHRLLTVGVSMELGTDAVSGITYGGTALTFFGAQSGSTDPRCELWYLVDPPVGTASVAVTLNSATDCVAGSISFFDVDPSDPFRTDASASGNDTNPTVTVPGLNENDLIVDVQAAAVAGGAVSPTVGSDQTQRWSRAAAPIAGSGVRGSGSTQPGTVFPITMDWTYPVSHNWTILAASLRPFVCGSDPC